MLCQYLFHIGTKKVENNFFLMLCQKFVIVETPKNSICVYFVTKLLCENLFNLGSQKRFFLLYLQLLGCSLYREMVFCEMKNMQCCRYFFGSFLNVDN